MLKKEDLPIDFYNNGVGVDHDILYFDMFHDSSSSKIAKYVTV